MFKRYKDWDEDHKIAFFTGLIMGGVWCVFIFPALCYSYYHFGGISVGWWMVVLFTAPLAFVCLFTQIVEYKVELYFTKKRIFKEIEESALEREALEKKAFENFAKHHYGNVIKIGDNIKIGVSPDGGFIYRETTNENK